MSALLTLGQEEGLTLVPVLVMLAIFIAVIAGTWMTFTKAGQPGWGILIPIYNLYLLCKIAGRPGWWVLLMFIPIVNIIILIIVCIDIARAFGKGPAFGIGLWLLGFIFFPILGFGSATYQTPAPAVPPQPQPVQV